MEGEHDFLIRIVIVTIFILVTITLLLYLYPVLMFGRRYNKRREVSKLNRKKISKKLHDDMHIFVNTHKIRPWIFFRKFQRMLGVTYNEGYRSQ